MQPKISIITVVYNDVAHIIETMDSVIHQTYSHIEYILIDGASSDGTTESIESKIASIASITHRRESEDSLYLEARLDSNPDFSFKFLSERDTGIYDAMNKGIDLATGEWCNFMNCGDRFYNLEVLGQVVREIEGFKKTMKDMPAVIYGDTQIMYDEQNTKILYAAPSERKNAHKYTQRFIHQSAFIATNIAKVYKYDTKFKIMGDMAFFLEIYNKGGYVFKKITCIVCVFSAGGVSGRLSWKTFIEGCAISFRYNVFISVYYALRYIFWVIPRVLVRNAIPNKFRNKARVIFGKKYH